MLTVALVGAASSDAAGTATARLSNAHAGARPVVVTLRFATVYECGVPKRAVVTLPLGERVPTRFASGTIRIDGRVATRVSVDGRAVTLGGPRAGVTCHSLRLGTELVVFTARARLGNPARAGRYAITIRQGSTVVSARFAIRP